MEEESSAPSGKLFYRSLEKATPSLEDFLPPGQRGFVLKRPANAAYLERWNNDVSVFDTIEAAVKNAEANQLGPYLAEVFVPDGGPVSYRKTGPDPNHFDLRGPAEAMLANVRRIVTP